MRPPALRMMWASPSEIPRALAGSIRASMHTTTATLLGNRADFVSKNPFIFKSSSLDCVEWRNLPGGW